SDAPGFGAITTICAGGRYDGLVEELGGPETPGFGFALGLERLMLTLEAEKIDIPNLHELDVYVVGIGEETNVEALKLVQAIRSAGFSAERDYFDRKAKAQFKTAAKLKAKVVLTLGEEELKNGQVNFKVMKNGKESTVSLKEAYQDFEKL